MTSRIPFFLLSCVLCSVGCQSLNSMLPWTAKSDDYTLDELAALDTTATTPQLDHSFAMNDSASRITQASYTQSDGPKDLSAQRSIPELLAAGKTAIQLGAAGDTDKVAESRRLFESILDQNRQHTEAHHGIAMAADLQNDWESAVYHYKQALKIRPNDADLLNDLGYSYLLQGRDRDSRTYLQRALEIAPNHKHAVKNLARLSLQQGNASEAQRILATLYPPQEVLQEYSKLAELVSESRPPTAALPDLPKDATPQQVLQRMRQEKERATALRQQKALKEAGRAARERTLIQPPPYQPNGTRANAQTSSHSYSMHPPVSTTPVSAPALSSPNPMDQRDSSAAIPRNVVETVQQPDSTVDPSPNPKTVGSPTQSWSDQEPIRIQPAGRVQRTQLLPQQTNQNQQFVPQQQAAPQPMTQQQPVQQPQPVQQQFTNPPVRQPTMQQQPMTPAPQPAMQTPVQQSRNGQYVPSFQSPPPMTAPPQNVVQQPAAPVQQYQSAQPFQNQRVQNQTAQQQPVQQQPDYAGAPPVNQPTYQAPPVAVPNLPSNVEAQYPITASETKPLGRSVPLQPMTPRNQQPTPNAPVPTNSHHPGNQAFQPGLIQQLMPPADAQRPQAYQGRRSAVSNAELIASMQALGMGQNPAQSANAQNAQSTTPANANYTVNSGAAYSRPPSVLPAQEYLQQMQQPPQHPTFGESTSGQVPSANTIVPASQSQTNRSSDPLAAFEATLQKLDRQYNQAMQQVRGSRLQ